MNNWTSTSMPTGRWEHADHPDGDRRHGADLRVCSVGFCDVEETSLPIYCNLEDEAFRYLIEDANARNQVDGLEQLSAGDQILTLATCTEKETERLVIVAKQIYDTMIATEEDAHS